jgi:predicted ribosomally synthesized peptide with SipW-like signal peptide
METRKIAIGILAIGIVAALSGGMIYAYFTDSDKSENNEFTAGKLFLQLNDGVTKTVTPALGTFDNMQPGDSGTGSITVKNAGTVDGYVTFKFSDFGETDGLPTEVDGTDLPDPSKPQTLGGNLGTVITVKYGDGGSKTVELGDDFFTTIMAEIEDDEYHFALPAGESLTIEISWSIATSVGNEIQGDSLSFDIEFTLTQSTHNSLPPEINSW